MRNKVTKVLELVFRQITPADFFNINKQLGAEAGGGGQSYIDVPVKKVDMETWHDFFSDIEPEAAGSGPLWNVEINSLGGLGSQNVLIGQRRAQSVNIRSQKLHSRRGNRVFAWHPDQGGFPRAPEGMHSAEDPRVIELTDGVKIFILKTERDGYWAGWQRAEEIERLANVDARFKTMLAETAGHLSFQPTVELNTNNLRAPFVVVQRAAVGESAEDSSVQGHSKKRISNRPELSVPGGSVAQGVKKNRTHYSATVERSEETIAAELFQDDISTKEVKKNLRITRVFKRNERAVNNLKKLYGTCQVTGDEYVFIKANGEPYLEVHHLVPLGEGGSDVPANLVVISAHIHRMLHYAVVEGIDLSKIEDGKLEFKINGEEFTITWLPEHANTIVDDRG